jgi:hypothetical protein
MEGWRNGDHATDPFFPAVAVVESSSLRLLRVPHSFSLSLSGSGTQQEKKQRLLNPNNGGGRAPLLHTLPALYLVRRLSCEDPAAAMSGKRGIDLLRRRYGGALSPKRRPWHSCRKVVWAKENPVCRLAFFSLLDLVWLRKYPKKCMTYARVRSPLPKKFSIRS